MVLGFSSQNPFKTVDETNIPFGIHYLKPSVAFAFFDIISGFHGGSQTI